MRRPSPFDFAIGNRLARVALLCMSAATLYSFARHHDDAMCGLSFFRVVPLSLYAARARDRVDTWRNWSRAWGETSESGWAQDCVRHQAFELPTKRTSRREPDHPSDSG